MSTDPQAPRTRPVFTPLQSSTGSSACQSYSSTASLSTPSSASAPLPSPTSAEQAHAIQQFYGSLNEQAQAQAQQMQHMQQPLQRQAVQRTPSYDYQPDRAGAGATAAETNSYLSQAALLAEAAKRAQMAVVMRDIEGMEL